jgi:hypothetical protein
MPAKQYLMAVLLEPTIDLSISFSWVINKNNPDLPPTVRGQQMLTLNQETRYFFIDALRPNGTSKTDIPISNLYPQFLHALPDGRVINLAPDSAPLYTNCTLRYHQLGNADNSSSVVAWWELFENISNTTLDAPQLYILSDNVPISIFASLSSYGLLGLYVVVVFAAGRFIRSAISDLTLHIMYEDLPNPDPVLQICSETLLAREFGDFETEETLYWQLITLFRSPQSLMAKTHIKEE